ncbi:4Fe-4S ferredoxin, partial [Streptomyces sp. SID10244]|nr:4Fe-4S ferredoxin [Streptomyces sp. SID10244]
GNVALDVARILVSPPELLATTDIADRALRILEQQNIHEVVVLGRRDQASAAYTSAEYRALSTIPGVEIVVHDDPSADAPDLRGPADRSRRRIVFLFHTSPDEIVGEQRVEGVTVQTGGT